MIAMTSFLRVLRALAIGNYLRVTTVSFTPPKLMTAITNLLVPSLANNASGRVKPRHSSTKTHRRSSAKHAGAVVHANFPFLCVEVSAACDELSVGVQGGYAVTAGQRAS